MICFCIIWDDDKCLIPAHYETFCGQGMELSKRIWSPHVLFVLFTFALYAIGMFIWSC